MVLSNLIFAKKMMSHENITMVNGMDDSAAGNKKKYVNDQVSSTNDNDNCNVGCCWYDGGADLVEF